MASPIGIVLVAFVGYFLYLIVYRHLKHIAIAKRTGLPYIITPISVYNAFWLATHNLWIPYLLKLPKSWTESWLPYAFLSPDWPWIDRFEPFKKHGSDILLVVSPGGIHMWLANAEAIHQISSKRDSFPKPIESYKLLDIFGRNVVTTEGGEWKQHRKITAPGFSEKNNALVFAESCIQTEGMLSKWISTGESGKKTIKSVPEDAMRLALHIISKVGFGVQLLWAEQTHSMKTEPRGVITSSKEAPMGHTMTFEKALKTLLEKFAWIILVPQFILKFLPFESSKIAFEAYINWRDYMNELFEQKIQEAREGQRIEGMDIMGSLVRSSYGHSKTNMKNVSSGQAEKEAVPMLTDSEILGNAFVMILAGHETTANSVHFTLIELAMRLKTQRLMHKEVEKIFGDEPSEKWNYDKNINALLGGILGAALNEQLRVMPPVVAIPKSILKNQDQVIVMDGKKVTFPAGCYISLNTVAAHRNPRNWPSQPSEITGAENDLDDFRPERWLAKAGRAIDRNAIAASSEDDEDVGGPSEEATSAQLFRPVKGAYIPFSEGARSCLGRRLAQVEMMAVFAVFFQKYSIELAVDEWATDHEVSKMSDEEKRCVYNKAQEKAREMLRGATTVITLKLQIDPGFIPVRIVKKGEERFMDVVE